MIDIIGVPREIKDQEGRVAITPAGAAVLAQAGHTVMVESGAGRGSGFDDQNYINAGATIVPTSASVWQQAELIVKVKEPLPSEYGCFRPGQVLFTYLHLAGVDPDLTRSLVDRRVTALAHETLQLKDGRLPLLEPMSAIAGRLAVQIGARYLERTSGGRGVLLSGVPGVARGRVVIIGAGTVGRNAAQIAAGMGASVLVLNRSVGALAAIEQLLPNVMTEVSTPDAVAAATAGADLVIGAVLVAGAQAPKLVTESMVASMRAGAVIVDVAIDQGGCIETTRPTSHSEPVYVEHGVLHYAVPNMPGAVPRTSALALTNATLPYVVELARLGVDRALLERPELVGAINVRNGQVVHPAVAVARRASAPD